jgi:hypothetical protein
MGEGIMADIEIVDGILVVTMHGLDKLWAFKSRIEIPLSHVIDARKAGAEAGDLFAGLRIVGTSLPGVLRAGTFRRNGEWVFWDVHDADNVVTIRLRDEHYAELIIGVADPAAVVSTITRQIP